MLIGKSKFHRETKKDNLDIKKESYEFIEDIMEDRTFSRDAKDIFWNEFASRYIESKNFRYLTHGKLLIFDHNNIYRGISETEEEGKNIAPEKGRYIVYIGDDEIEGTMKNLYPPFI